MSGGRYSGDAVRLILTTLVAIALALGIAAGLGALVGPPIPLVALP